MSPPSHLCRVHQANATALVPSFLTHKEAWGTLYTLSTFLPICLMFIVMSFRPLEPTKGKKCMALIFYICATVMVLVASVLLILQLMFALQLFLCSTPLAGSDIWGMVAAFLPGLIIAGMGVHIWLLDTMKMVKFFGRKKLEVPALLV